jgi:hypothetical protein
VVHHRVHGRPPQLAQARFLRLREQQPVHPVGHEGKGGRVRGDAPPEEVRDGDVGNAAVGQARDVGVDLLLALSEVKAALDRVYQDELVRGARLRELGGRVRDCRVCVTGDVVLDQSQLIEQAGEVDPLG